MILRRALAVAVVTGVTCAVSFALVMSTDGGTWPDSWPKELEPYRVRATTVGVAHGTQETVYEIPFSSREEFEKAWPHILTLKSKSAPLILDKSQSTYAVSGSTMSAGVRILCPSGGIVTTADGTRLEAKAPWPESVTFGTSVLPEYVTVEGGKWVPYVDKGQIAMRNRARVDIMLVVDGRTVDLNRIELPSDTPIVDRRFRK